MTTYAQAVRAALIGVALGVALCVPTWFYLADWCVRWGWQC